MTIDAPLVIHRETVPPEWIDYNGHMNVAYYVLAFDHATDSLFDHIGLDEAYRARHKVSSFAMENHITYLRELHEGDPLRFEIQLLDLDEKRFHYINCMYHDTENFLAATAEWLSIHVDMEQRRATPMGEPMFGRMKAILEAHKDLPRPPQVGRVIGIRRGVKAG